MTTATITRTTRCRHGMRSNECASCLKVPRKDTGKLRPSVSYTPPATDDNDLTFPQMILLAALTFDEPFTREQLTVEVWKRYPRAFGLASYQLVYPDSNKVIAALSGDRGLVRRGLLSRKDGRYEVADKGMEAGR